MTVFDPSAPSAPPQAVTIAYWLYVVGAVLGLIGAVVVGVSLPESIAANQAASTLAQQEGTQVGSTTLSAAVVAIAVTFSVVSIVLSIAYSVLMLVFAPRMRRGGGRARTTLIVLAGLQVFGALGAYGVGFAHLLVVLAALILTVLPTSSAWFRAMHVHTIA